jgi:DNA repair protein RAD7
MIVQVRYLLTVGFTWTNLVTELSKDDFVRIFMLVPQIKNLKLVNANQFKAEAMGYIIDKKIRLEKLDLLGANLIDEGVWDKFFKLQTSSLKTLKLSWIDGKFTPKNIKTLVKFCPEISHLSLRRLWETLNAETLKELLKLKKVTNLSLEFNKDIAAEPMVNVVEAFGSRLEKLSLKCVPEADDELLAAIHDSCTRLSKLTLTDNDTMSDAGFVSLFTDWTNPPLTSINFHTCRDVDANHPETNTEGLGFCSDGFKALMAHSGPSLEVLNISSDRHISHDAFLEVFDGKKRYEKLRIVDVSFVPSFDDVAINGLFQSAPNLQKVLVFGVFGVRNPSIPAKVVVLGMPNAALLDVEEGGVLASL